MNGRTGLSSRPDRDPEWHARLRRLLDEAPEYQAFVLPDGSSTPGYDRSYLLPRLFGDDFHGKTFFDIGSYLGYFCVEALQRGATSATGIETDPRNLRQAREFAELLEVRPEYIRANFEEWDDQGRQFDTVACLNVLHHLFDPLGALQKMMRMTRDRLVLEVAVPTWRDVMRDRMNPLRVYGIGSPAMFLGIPKKRGDAAGRTYLFTPGALKIVLNVHTAAFEPVTISRSPFKGRVLVEARKRRIGDLAIVTGPTSVGKSTLIDRLMADASLRAQYGLDGSDWQLLQASEADGMPSGRNERVLLHYDFLRPSRTGIRSYDRDPVLHLMGVADRVTVLTLMAPAERLRSHVRSGEMARLDRTSRQRKRDRDLLKKYESGVFLNDWYNSWVAFCGRHADRLARHDLIVNDGSFRSFPIETWPARFAEAFPANAPRG
ncbi:MAG: class I SAM-dependent methyltransferase [Rhodospirillaceae bacterium]|nr:class I SAM-dependent methyltransferase [Rhodospirillaceae bacterium]